MEGVIRTRVGYAGGKSADPTYRRIGDHTECIQVDFDPTRITFEELLGMFFEMHNPTRPAYSTQYASLVLAHDDAQAEEALAARGRWAESLGSELYTHVRRLDRFFPAEDYHQKYGLRSDRQLMREFDAMYPAPEAFRESTAAARVNGYVYAGGSLAQLEREIESYGLGASAAERLRTIASRRY